MRPADAAQLSPRDQVRLLSGGNVWETQPLTEGAHGVDVPAIRMNDGPHGMRVQVGEMDHLGIGESEPATCFPPAVTLASSWDPDLIAEVGAAVATEARALGTHVVLGPGMNLKRHPLGGRNFEYFSEDPLLTGRLAEAMVRGIQSRGVGACVKHFAVNNQETERFVVDAVLDERTLRELYLSAFEYAITRADPWLVMCGYNSVAGDLCSENPRLLTAILREEWGFEGLVVSDWGAVADRAKGVAAGLDLEMPGGHKLSDPEVMTALAEERLDLDEVTRSAQRVLDLVARAQAASSGPVPALADVRGPHDALARRAAAQGTVLVRNDGILPLALPEPATDSDADGDPTDAGAGAETEPLRVALIGAFADHPRYQGSGSSLVNALQVTGAHEALLDAVVDGAALEVGYAPGYDPRTAARDPALIDEAVALAADADVAVVLVGLPGAYESEGYDRADLALPEQHDALVAGVAAVNPRTVVSLSCGAPVLMPWREQVAAILIGHLGGQAGGGALVDVLLGRAEPAGRLAETWPAQLGDVAADPWFPGTGRQVQHREGLFVGYRHAVTARVKPAYAFGHGLGYARCTWGPAEVTCAASADGVGGAGGADGDAVRVGVEVTNPSARETTEVVQVYLSAEGDPDGAGAVLRPERWLAGFGTVRLAPGESRTVWIEVPARAFAIYDVEVCDWRIPAGRYDLLLARSSVEVEQRIPVEQPTGQAGVNSAVVPAEEIAAEPADAPPIAWTAADFVRRLGGPIPEPTPIRPFSRDSTFAELSTTPWGRRSRNLLRRFTPRDREGDEGTRLMMERAFDQTPLRGVARFALGRLPWTAVDAIVDLANAGPRGLLSKPWRR